MLATYNVTVTFINGQTKDYRICTTSDNSAKRAARKLSGYMTAWCGSPIRITATMEKLNESYTRSSGDR
jgi:hypothetical protein